MWKAIARTFPKLDKESIPKMEKRRIFDFAKVEALHRILNVSPGLILKKLIFEGISELAYRMAFI